jgi:high affinity sulfate transporter 1
MFDRLARISPGLATLARYRRQDLLPDLVAGLSVAAIALPVGVAYAALAGYHPAAGLYSSILPLVVYALFGSSRQLIIGPDAATCALVAAAAGRLAAGDHDQYVSVSVTLTLFAGLLSVGASFLNLGVLADFFSRPILTGIMNGIALSIALGQLGKILGFTIEAGGIVPRALELAKKLDQTHLPTLAVGLCSFALLLISPRLLRRAPAALLTMVLAALAVGLLGLDARGVEIVGDVQAGLPALVFPRISPDALKPLVADAASIALISFTSLMLTARSFAARTGYEVDANRDLAALGVANIASAVAQGFAVSGADSRTAMNDAAGGRTQASGLFAAAAIALVLIFLTAPLRYVPQAALGASLVMASWSLVSIKPLRLLWGEDKGEFAISLAATLAVIAVGSIDAILFAVVLSLLRFVRIVARPPCEVLGLVDGLPGFHSIERHPEARTLPGICLLRFNSPLVFFNAAYFKRSVLDTVATAGAELRWLVFDALPVTSHDFTGRSTMREVDRELAGRGIRVAFAGRQTEITAWLRAKGFDGCHPASVRAFPTLQRAVDALRNEPAANATVSPGL